MCHSYALVLLFLQVLLEAKLLAHRICTFLRLRCIFTRLSSKRNIQFTFPSAWRRRGLKAKCLLKIFICLLNIYWASIICTTLFWALGVHWWPRTLKFVSLCSCFSNNGRFGKMSSLVDELTNMTYDVTQMTSERHSEDSGVAPRCRWWHHCTWDNVPPHFPSYALPCA